MKIISVLEHDGEIYKIGDLVRVIYDNNLYDEGIINYFGVALDGETGYSDSYLRFGGYMEKLSDIKHIEKLE